jgi:hypothetical protein
MIGLIAYLGCSKESKKGKTIIWDEPEWYDRNPACVRELTYVSSAKPVPGLYLPIMEWVGVQFLPWAIELKSDGSGMAYIIHDTPNEKRTIRFAWVIDTNMTFVITPETTKEGNPWNAFLGFLDVCTLKGECHQYNEELGSTYMEVGYPGKIVKLFPFEEVEQVVTKVKKVRTEGGRTQEL